MHRVELKGGLVKVEEFHHSGFLMHRVELKGS